MESILLGIIGFSALFGIEDPQYSSFEVGHLNYKENPDSSEIYNKNEFSNFTNTTFGSRDFDLHGNNWRIGYASYLFGSNKAKKENKRQLHMYGGYVGYFVEYSIAQYFSLGIMAGGGSAIVEYDTLDGEKHKLNQYFGYSSPYFTVGFPLASEWSLNLTGSSYFLAEPSRQINGQGDTYLAGQIFSHKLGIEIVWKN
jgi:hypothetical protein